MKTLHTFVSAMVAGSLIGVGGATFLSCENRVVGAVFFALGLLTIVTRGLCLFTGKAGYLVGQKADYLGFLAVVWLGNFAGTGLTALLLRATRFVARQELAAALWQTKSADSLGSLFILGIFCGLLMFLAVDGYRTAENPVAKVVLVIFCVVVFILCGFEHCVANMFYGWFALCWTPDTLMRLVVISVGNVVGGVAVPLCDKLKPQT